MSIEQYQRTVNSLDDEIAKLNKKKSDVDKKYADLQGKINSIKRSITKSTSSSTLKSKTSQIQRYENDASKRYSESAELTKKIADKQKKRNESYMKLQKAQQNESKKKDRENKRIQEIYRNQIDNLQKQLSVSTAQVFTSLENENINLTSENYDVFVSHAWEDKEDFVDEFVCELEKLNIKVWYDKKKISWGDSMRARIDEGLKKSKFGIAVLSPNYIAEGKYWTKAELNGLFQLESVNGKTLLPIWHNLTKKQVIEYSPIIADKLAMTTANMTPSEIAEELNKILNDSLEDEE